jgi:tetratricopeptide (TPR) repeat protein
MLPFQRVLAEVWKITAIPPIADFDQVAIKSDPTYSGAWYARAAAWGFKRDFERAVGDYGEAIRLDPKNPSPVLDRCIAYVDNRDYDHAIADYSEIIRLDPKSDDAFNRRGIAYHKKGDYDRATQTDVRDFGVDRTTRPSSWTTSHLC